jgi:hypothetical protein
MPKVSYRKVRQPLGAPLHLGNATVQLYRHKFFIEFRGINESTKGIEKKTPIRSNSPQLPRVEKTEEVKIKTENCKFRVGRVKQTCD